MRIHLIACGGAVMHNFAIALHKKGYIVSGSDDEIFDPAKSRLEQHGLLPEKWGWFPEKITKDIDIVILGMHARKDNPELLTALELGLKVVSFPEYVYEQSKNKTRIVIAGSHGKTTTTAMIMHVLKYFDYNFDYLVGSEVEGFDTMVKITENADFIVIEGDEYLSSAIDMRPKFHHYKPHIAVITGIAWDHINVFPSYENYVEQFEIFCNLIEEKGTLIWCSEDKEVEKIVNKIQKSLHKIPYSIINHTIKNNITYLLSENKEYQLQIFGKHNMMNLSAAMEVCKKLGITEQKFCEAITTFKGAARRLELIAQNDKTIIFRDFAHSPSKVRATIEAVKNQFPQYRLIACLELHTFSSLNVNFLTQYKNTMTQADEAIVYFNPHTLQQKKLPPIECNTIKEAFGDNKIEVFNDSSDLVKRLLKNNNQNNTVLLLMSSGNFDGINYKEFAKSFLT